MKFWLSLAVNLILIAGLVAMTTAAAADDNQSLVKQGHYISHAADCMACHAGPDGTPYAGGEPIATPMGKIVAPNISSSKKYGIGNYSVDDLAGVLRDGVTPSGKHLYPAMPYPAYRGMTDHDIKALHAYLQSLPAVNHAPKAETDVNFPFNLRFLMVFWNWQNLGQYQPPEHLNKRARRGQYIVDHLAHCGTCHTPRNDLLGSDYDHYLGGSALSGWYAPNITSDTTAGIGRWSDHQIANYLKNGRMSYAAQAAGPMGEAVHESLQYLDENDRMAVAAYLKTVSSIAGKNQKQPVFDPKLNGRLKGRAPVITHATDYSSGQLAQHGLKPDTITQPNSPAGLYATHCAGCHGDKGYGQPVSYFASLVGNTTVRHVNPGNLIAVILHGVAEHGATPGPLMPGFNGKLNNQQIAAVANYVRNRFGGFADSDIDADEVAYIDSGKTQPVSTLIRYAPLLAWIGIAVLVIIILLIGGGGWYWWRRRQRTLREAHSNA